MIVTMNPLNVMTAAILSIMPLLNHIVAMLWAGRHSR